MKTLGESVSNLAAAVDAVKDATWHALPLGEPVYTETTICTVEAYAELPEGFYLCEVEMYQGEWRRPLWPFPVAVHGARITIPGGIPIPGDRLYGINATGDTVGEVLDQLRASVLRSRGREDWAPGVGWPEHCMVR